MNFSLAGMKQSTPIIKDIKTYLAKATRQDVISIDLSQKLKKVAGEPTKSIIYYLSGGQQVEFVFRKNGDIVKIKINKREHPTAGHLIYEEKEIFKIAIEEIAHKIVKTQRAFELRKAKTDSKNAGEVGSTISHKDGKDATKTTARDLNAEIEAVDKQIEEKWQEVFREGERLGIDGQMFVTYADKIKEEYNLDIPNTLKDT